MALTAVPVGFVAGLFGIGWWFNYSSISYYIFGSLGIDQQLYNAFSSWNLICNNNSNINSFSFNPS